MSFCDGIRKDGKKGREATELEKCQATIRLLLIDFPVGLIEQFEQLAEDWYEDNLDLPEDC